MDTRMNQDPATQSASPTLSIVMPTHNRAGYIGIAIESVLIQTYSDWELIVVDDGSTDETEAVVEAFIKRDARIHYIRQNQNKGIASTRNNGVAQARGRYIAMLDSDDAWSSPEKLARQIAALEADPELGIVGTWLEIINEKGVHTGDRLSYAQDDAGIRAKQIYKNSFAQSSVIFRKDAFEKAGGYDGRFIVTDDHDLWLKIGRSYRFATLPQYDLLYRRHSGNITRTRRITAAHEELEILRKHRAYYPGFYIGLLKGFARLGLAFVR